MRNTFIAIVMAIITIPAFAQTKWEGHINYTITVSGNEDIAQNLNGSTMDNAVKDSMTKTTMNLSSFESNTIMNTATKKGTLLIDFMGNKFAVALSSDDIKQYALAAGDYDVKYEDSSKLIAGHLCKKATVTMKSDKKQFMAWYAPDIKIPIVNKYMYSKIDGLPMDYEMEQGPITMRFTCTLLDTNPVDASNFVIPDGYQSMSMDQFKAAMGGMGGH